MRAGASYASRVQPPRHPKMGSRPFRLPSRRRSCSRPCRCYGSALFVLLDWRSPRPSSAAGRAHGGRVTRTPLASLTRARPSLDADADADAPHGSCIEGPRVSWTSERARRIGPSASRPADAGRFDDTLSLSTCGHDRRRPCRGSTRIALGACAVASAHPPPTVYPPPRTSGCALSCVF